jgi:hypothetical protein
MLYADYNGEIRYENLAPTEREKTTIYAKDENGKPYQPSWWTLNLNTSYRLPGGLHFRWELKTLRIQVQTVLIRNNCPREKFYRKHQIYSLNNLNFSYI